MPAFALDDAYRAVPVQLIDVAAGVILKRGAVEARITGPMASETVQFLLSQFADVGVTPESVCAMFPPNSRSAIAGLLEMLFEHRLLVSVDGPTPIPGPETGLDVFHWTLGQSAQPARDALASLAITLVGINHISRELVRQLVWMGISQIQIVDHRWLRNLKLFTEDNTLDPASWSSAWPTPLTFEEWDAREHDSPSTCVIAASDFGGQRLMRPWNRECLARRCDFLPIVLQDMTAYVGPLVVPGRTPCYECLWARQNSLFADPATRREIEGEAFVGQQIASAHPGMYAIAAGLAAVEIDMHYAQLIPAHSGTLLEANLTAGVMKRRNLLKIPRCPVCGIEDRWPDIAIRSRRLIADEE